MEQINKAFLWTRAKQPERREEASENAEAICANLRFLRSFSLARLRAEPGLGLKMAE